LTHNKKSYRKGGSCVKISVTEGGKGDTTQHNGICTGTKKPIFSDIKRRKGETCLVKEYGLVGFALLMAIPLPTIGVYGGTLLSWLMGMNWWSSLIAVALQSIS
jgi:hypothetical protein